MNRKYISCLILFAGLASCLFIGCGEDRWPEYYPYTKRALWIDDVMREHYLWYDDIPEFNDLNYFKSPNEFLSQIISGKDKNFSTVDTLTHTADPSYGFDYTLSRVPDNDTAYYAMLTYVVPQSPAADAGLKRGEWIMDVDGTFITKKTESILSGGESRRLTIGKYRVSTEIMEDGKEKKITEVVKDREGILPAARPVQDAVIPMQEIIDNNIAYLAYNSFDTLYNQELLQFSKVCQQHSVEHFILDLRYNTGGDMQCVQLLAGILVPAEYHDSPLATLKYSDKQSARNHTVSIDPRLLIGGASLNLKRIYILTGSATAGASEMLINCLMPYMEVVQIGSTTKGVYVGTEAFANYDLQWVLRPAVCTIFNASGEGEYSSGFAPEGDMAIDHLKDPARVLPLGDSEEALLSAALDKIRGISEPAAAKSAEADVAFRPVKSVVLRRNFPSGIRVD